MTNDLLEREDQIIELKKRVSEFQQALTTKDKMFEQDAMVRMQLGKRLEQVLMDKEDAIEQMELLKVCSSLVHSLIFTDHYHRSN